MRGPKMGSRMKKTITPTLTMARLSRRRRRNDSWRGVGDFLGFCPGRITGSSGCCTIVAISLFSASFSTSRGDIVVSGCITPGEASSKSLSFGSICFTCLLFGFNARVYNAIQDIRNQVSYYDSHGQQHNCGLDDRVVAVSDGDNGLLPDAGNVEDGLYEECARHQQANGKAENSNEWDHRIAESMAVHYDALAQPFRARGAHIVLAQHFQHAGASNASEEGGADRREDQDWRDPELDIAPTVLPGIAPACDGPGTPGRVVQPYDDDLGKNCQHERWQCIHNQHKTHIDSVNPGVSFERRDDADRYAYQQLKNERPECEFC